MSNSALISDVQATQDARRVAGRGASVSNSPVSTLLGVVLLSALIAIACAGSPPEQPPTDTSSAQAVPPASQVDHPPEDLKSDKLVRCLIDTPEGCTGCDQGTSCVYQELPEFDCIYIVYGAKCDEPQPR